jgi:hypothetical protein
MQRRLAILAVTTFLVTLGAVSASADGTPTTVPAAPLAMFEGGLIDLSQGWGDAQACLIDRAAGIAECFRASTGLQAREAQLAMTTPAPSIALASCSSPLRLFADSNYGGRELDLYDRGYWQNLSTWGFDNVLSSYKVGACSVHLAENANGGGYWYPGNTNAGHSEPAMTAGSTNWDNRVSSAYLQ